MTKEFVITKGILTKYNGEGGHVVIPEKVTAIDGAAFYQCQTIIEIEIPGTVKQIVGDQQRGAFCECANLEKVILHEGVEEIGTSAFYNCEKLTEITVPASVSTFGAYAFGNTPWQRAKGPVVIVNNVLLRWYREEPKAVIPDGVKAIGASAFEQNEMLEEICIPDSVTRIETWAFYGCKNLRIVHLPKALSYVGESAFEYTPWIDNGEPLDIYIPEGTVSIGKDCFKGLSLGHREELIKWENVYRATGHEVPKRTVKDLKGPVLRSVVFASSVRSVDYLAFTGCRIQNLQLNEGLESIGPYAFAYCAPLRDVVLPDSLTQLGEDAFNNCDAKIIVRSCDKVFSSLDREVRERTIHKWLERKLECTPAQEKPMIKYVNRTRNAWVQGIEDDDADILSRILACGKTKLEQVDAYIEMVNDGKHPQMLAVLLEFKQKNFAQEQIELVEDQKIGLAERTVKDWEKIYRLKKDQYGYILVKYKGIDKHPEVPSEIEGTPVYEIGKNAFKENDSIVEIDIPGNIQTIGDSAFEKCNKLKTIHFSEGLKHIGKRAFYHCEALSDEMRLPEGLLTNGVNAFDFGDNQKLKELHIPASMQELTGSFSLYGIKKLYLYGLHTQVDYSLIDVCGTIYLRKNSDAAQELTAYANASGYCKGILKYIDESRLPTNIKPETEAVLMDDQKKQAGDEKKTGEKTEYVFHPENAKGVKGKTFAIAGTLKTFDGNAEVRTCLKACGAALASRVDLGVKYLITNTPSKKDSKHKDAEFYGIKKITEEEFNRMIGRMKR